MREIRKTSGSLSSLDLAISDSSQLEIRSQTDEKIQVLNQKQKVITVSLSYCPENPFGSSETEIESHLEIYPDSHLISVQGGSTRVIREIIECLNSCLYDNTRILPNLGVSIEAIRNFANSADFVFDISLEGIQSPGNEDSISIDDGNIKEATLHFLYQQDRAQVVYEDGHLWISADSEQAYQTVVKQLLQSIEQ